MDFVSIPFIVIISYLIAEIYKYFIKDEKKRNFIPLLMAISGGILGIIVYFVSPEMIAGDKNIFHAILVGIFSGTSATGANQIVKKIFNINIRNDDVKSD